MLSFFPALKIHVTEETRMVLENFPEFVLEERGEIHVKVRNVLMKKLTFLRLAIAIIEITQNKQTCTLVRGVARPRAGGWGSKFFLADKIVWTKKRSSPKISGVGPQN